MSQTTIRPTGMLRAAGWPLLVLGLLLMFSLIDHPYVGIVVFIAGLAMVLLATKRAAANREAVQRATLER